MAVTTEQQRIAEWRAQLAEEEGSDDDDAYGLAGKPPTFDDDDVGLGLEEPGLPQRPHEGPTAASRANRLNKSPPGRHSKGPAELHGLGGAGAERLVVGGRGGGDFVGRSPTKATNLQSGEETEALRRKVQVLHLQLEERDIELSQARALAGAAADATSGPVDARDAKLRELAKRAKAATMALGRERARAAQLAADLAAARKEASGGGAAAAAGADGGALSIEAREAQVKELKDARDRLAASNAKLHEAKVGAAALKADLDRHRRALTREVGDEATAARLLHDDGGNSAKGRAEQISLLKDRLREATRRLEAAGADGDGGGGGGGGYGGGGGGAGSPSRESRVDESHRAALASLEAERRREMERVMLREQQLEGEVGELRRKETGAAARIRNLEADVKSKKEKLKQLLDKSDADDELVHALQIELQKLRKGGGRSGGGGGGGGGGSPAGGRGGVEAAAEVHAQRRRLEELSTRAVQQQAQIDRQEHIILALRQQLQQQQQQRPQSGGANGGGYGGGGYGGGVKMPHDLIAVQTENGKLRELVALLQEKLVEAGA